MTVGAGARGAIRVLFDAGGFDRLPVEAKRGGPWTGTRTGELVRLKAEYRLALATAGYVRIVGQALGFESEA
jgi:hypothetical protein